MNQDQPSGTSPDLALLADYVEGRLDAEAAAGVEQALVVDPELRSAERWVRGFVAASADAVAVHGSPLATQRLRQHFERWARAQAALGEAVVRHRADLVFDSRTGTALVGVRGGASDVSLVFATEVAELAVEVLPAPRGRVQLLGQVMLNVDTDAPYFAAAVLGSDGRRQVESDEFGRFRFDDLVAEPAELRVSNGEVEISVTLPLGPAAEA